MYSAINGISGSLFWGYVRLTLRNAHMAGFHNYVFLVTANIIGLGILLEAQGNENCSCSSAILDLQRG